MAGDRRPNQMKPHDAKEAFEKYLAELGTPVSALTPAEAVRLMLGFYRTVRAEGAKLDLDQDMLLCQWGLYEREAGKSFQFDIIRQFIESGTEDEDGMTQLSLTFCYKPTPALEALGSGQQWCRTPAELPAFKNTIFNSAPYEAVASLTPEAVRLDYNEV